MIQQTLVVIKPDGVERNLIGEIIKRYEDAGLKIVKLKMMQTNDSLMKQHYPHTDEYFESIGKKSAAAGDNITDFIAQGRKIVSSLVEYLQSGPVVAMVLEGEEAIPLVRKVTGYTDPATAEKGTIRGDLGEDTILKANSEGRAVKNLIHASGNLEEATAEIKLWFGLI